MRGFDCHYYFYNSENKFTKCGNTACWGGIDYNQGYLPKDVKEIYIAEFTEPQTKQYIPLIIRIINRITPCELVEIEGKNYIKYTLIKGYDNNLILLNYIRNLWHNPVPEAGDNYCVSFFEDLKKSKFNDPLRKLMTASKRVDPVYSARRPYHYPPGHSNFCIENTIKVKPKEALLDKALNSTQSFLLYD